MRKIVLIVLSGVLVVEALLIIRQRQNNSYIARYAREAAEMGGGISAVCDGGQSRVILFKGSGSAVVAIYSGKRSLVFVERGRSDSTAPSQVRYFERGRFFVREFSEKQWFEKLEATAPQAARIFTDGDNDCQLQ